jgi:hypothetical protein
MHLPDQKKKLSLKQQIDVLDNQLEISHARNRELNNVITNGSNTNRLLEKHLEFAEKMATGLLDHLNANNEGKKLLPEVFSLLKDKLQHLI